MSYNARIILDSLSVDGDRLTTIEVTLPRLVLAELNTHRAFSRNSASSRAIPIEKMLKKVQDDPFIPIYWGKNQKGMQAEQEISHSEQLVAENEWLKARDAAIKHTKTLLDLGIHKQITNRLLEPFLWHTVIITATEWENFFALRAHPAAQPEIRRAAEMMREVYEASVPKTLSSGQWHLPFIAENESWPSNYQIDDICKVSIGRCARVSYLTHDGKRDPRADVELCERLASSGHMSPFEHVARPMTRHDIEQFGINASTRMFGNFRGWVQYRKLIANESNFKHVLNNH